MPAGTIDRHGHGGSPFRLRRGLAAAWQDAPQKLGHGGHPAEELLDVEQRRLLHEVGAGMVRGVVQHHAEIFQEEAVAQRRLHADVGGDAGEHQRADAARAQHAVEVGVEEGAVARLGDHDVALLRQQLVDQRVVPAALGQQLALQLGRGRAWSSSRWTCTSWASPARRPRHSRVPAVLEEDHLHRRPRAPPRPPP